ncbi:MAG: antitoxin [Actinobacteria bacterium]|nr:antitoxin [Actinomycetota bacterium]
MPRTTLDIDKTVLLELKQRQQREHKSLGKLASELLASAMANERAQADQPEFEWKTAPMNAIVDIADKEALFAALDGE